MTRFLILFILITISSATIFGQVKYNNDWPKIEKIVQGEILLNNNQTLFIPEPGDTSKQVVFLVKHVEEDSIGLDPGLSYEGNVRANRLMKLLKNAHIQHIYSILFRRTVLTIRPLVKEIKVPIKHYDPGQIDYLTNAYFRQNRENSVVVGTDKSIQDLLNEISNTDHYQLLPQNIYNVMYYIEFNHLTDPIITALQY